MAREQHRGWRSESCTAAPAQDGLGLVGTDKLSEHGLDEPYSRAWAGSPGVISICWGVGALEI